MIDTEALGLRGVVAAYLVRGKENALIDMGYRSSADTITRDLEGIGIGPKDLHYLLPTHVHLDHAGSCGTLAQKFPNSSVLVHPKGEPHLRDPEGLVRSASGLFGEQLMRSFGLPEPIESKRLRCVDNDEEIHLGKGMTLRTIWTPGHAPHHLSFISEETGDLFTGDAVGVLHPAFPVLVPTTPPPSFSLPDAIESLEHLRTLSPKQLLTPHFGKLNEAGERIERNVEVLLQWETKVEKLLAEKTSPVEIVEALTKDTCERSGRSVSEFPDHLRRTVRVSALGFVRFLERGSK